MAGETTGETGEPAVQSTSEGRQNLASVLGLILMQLCIKMFWCGLYTAVPQVESEGETGALVFTGMLLFFADCLVQFLFMQDLGEAAESAGESQHFAHARVGCGATFVAAYTLMLLPYATTMLEIFRVGAWVTFVFNIGCLVEFKLGLFRKGANALSGE